MWRDRAGPHDHRFPSRYGWLLLKVSHHPTKFGGHRHCGSGDVFLMVERQYSTCSHLNAPFLLICKRNCRKLHEKLPPVRPETATRKRRRRKKLGRRLQSFCIRRKRSKSQFHLINMILEHSKYERMKT